MKISAVLFCFFLLLSCSTSPLESKVENVEGVMNRLDTRVSDSVKEEYQAPFVLDTAYIRGTELWIEVSYSGGCEEHDFLIVWPEVITMMYPPDFGVTVYHKNHSDHCEALVSKTLKTDLRDTPTGQFDPATISEMRITVVNGSKPEEQKRTR